MHPPFILFLCLFFSFFLSLSLSLSRCVCVCVHIYIYIYIHTYISVPRAIAQRAGDGNGVSRRVAPLKSPSSLAPSLARSRATPPTTDAFARAFSFLSFLLSKTSFLVASSSVVSGGGRGEVVSFWPLPPFNSVTDGWFLFFFCLASVCSKKKSKSSATTAGSRHHQACK